jgi:hypothetical protein
MTRRPTCAPWCEDHVTDDPARPMCISTLIDLPTGAPQPDPAAEWAAWASSTDGEVVFNVDGPGGMAWFGQESVSALTQLHQAGVLVATVEALSQLLERTEMGRGL